MQKYFFGCRLLRTTRQPSRSKRHLRAYICQQEIRDIPFAPDERKFQELSLHGTVTPV